MNKNKIFKVFLILIGISILIFGVYLYKLHSLSIIGNKIYEYRCTNVNPPRIAYKNSYLKYIDYTKFPEKYKKEDLQTFIGDYISEMRKYVAEENNWIEKQNSFINRLDYKLIEPWYFKKFFDYQMEMTKYYLNDAQSILNLWDKKISSDELMSNYDEIRKQQDDAVHKYNDFYDQLDTLFDWRKKIIIVPTPKGCTEENTTIPSTYGAFDWQIPPESTKVEPIVFTKDQLEDYYQTTKDPYVLHIRKVLNGYLDGTNVGMDSPELVIETHKIGDYTGGLASFDKNYYKSKFIVFSINDSIVGGVEISIIFQDKPDQIFTVWVYKLADGRYDIRSIRDNPKFTSDVMKKIQIQYKTILEDRVHSI